MIKYLVQVTLTSTGKQYGYIVYGSTMADADTNFAYANPGLCDPALFTRTLTFQA